MDYIEKTNQGIRKALLVFFIVLALVFAGAVVYYISVNERWQLWAPLAGAMLLSIAYVVRLIRFMKRESTKKID